MAESKIIAEGVKPEDAMRFWQDKVPVTSSEFKKLSQEARSRAFVASGLAKADMLSDLHASLYKALSEGQTFETWKASIPHILEETGWRGFRLETIFRTNTATAYMAGRYAQMQEVKKYRPYWQYIAVADDRTRPEHAALNGLVFEADNPFWDTNYPPNGFNCRCDVLTLSKRQVEKLGLTVHEKIPEPLIYTDPVSGVPIVVNTTYPMNGFGTNVGKDWLAGLSPTEAAAANIKDLATQAICKGAKDFASGEICTPPLAKLAPKHILRIEPGDILSRNMPEESYILAFMREFGLKGIDDKKIITLPSVQHPLIISKQLFLDKKTGNYKSNKNNRGQYIKLLARTIQNPYEIWETLIQEKNHIRTSLRLIRLFQGQGQEIGGFGVFTLRGNKWHANTVFTPEAKSSRAMLQYLEKQRVGTLIYREP